MQSLLSNVPYDNNNKNVNMQSLLFSIPYDKKNKNVKK